jgi:hypothetical protein
LLDVRYAEMFRALLNLARRALPVDEAMQLLDFTQAYFCLCVCLMSSQGCSEHGQVLVCLQTAEALGRFQHAGDGPA